MLDRDEQHRFALWEQDAPTTLPVAKLPQLEAKFAKLKK